MDDPMIPKFDFDWNKFHRDLDRALAAYIEDGGRPSNPIVELAEYTKSRTYPLWKQAQDISRNEEQTKNAATNDDVSGLADSTLEKREPIIAYSPAPEPSEQYYYTTTATPSNFGKNLWKALYQVAGPAVCRMIEGWHNEALAAQRQADARAADERFERAIGPDEEPDEFEADGHNYIKVPRNSLRAEARARWHSKGDKSK